MRDKDKKHNDKTDDNSKNTPEQNKESETPENASEELQKKVELLELELTVYKDKFLRKAAEFENYKRRTENDQLNLLKYGAEGFIRRILPVIDDLERSLQHMDNASELKNIKDGVKLVYDKLMKILNEQGVTSIEALGKEFDVHYHEALLQKKAEDVKPHTVIEELEKGYVYNDKVIRHSKVVVSEDSAPEDISDNGENADNGENG